MTFFDRFGNVSNLGSPASPPALVTAPSLSNPAAKEDKPAQNPPAAPRVLSPAEEFAEAARMASQAFLAARPPTRLQRFLKHIGLG